jgi:site-specific DNA-methyltransferase (adenine-specific)
LRIEHIGDATLYLGDCLEGMRSMPDKSFDLAIVDPPYGIGNFSPDSGSRGTSCKGKEWAIGWNNHIPSDEYFNSLVRVSKRQIIWGANYYNCFAPSGGAFIWYKGNGNPVFSQCEIASLSFQKRVDYCHIDWQAGFARGKEYKWLLSRYSKPGNRILDTHFGSGSNLVACNDLGFVSVGYELDEDYFNAACRRIADAYKQPRLFEDEKPTPKPQSLDFAT